MAYRMLAEWERHTRTWMALPPRGGYVEREDPKALDAWIATANAVADFGPVSLLVDPSEVQRVGALVAQSVELIAADFDDGWLRDSGPTFVIYDADGSLSAVHWVFNAWGGIQEHGRDACLGDFVARRAGASLVPSRMVNEGGGICVDGEGTVIVTESV